MALDSSQNGSDAANDKDDGDGVGDACDNDGCDMSRGGRRCRQRRRGASEDDNYDNDLQ